MTLDYHLTRTDMDRTQRALSAWWTVAHSTLTPSQIVAVVVPPVVTL